MSRTLLPTTNADGLPVVPMSEEQKYAFDLKGWICLPGLLTEARTRTRARTPVEVFARTRRPAAE